MTPHDTSREEQEIVESYERDEWRSVSALEQELARYRAYALASLGQTQQISISLPAQDLEAVQRKAQAAGVPYQTFISDLVHQFVTGRLPSQVN